MQKGRKRDADKTASERQLDKVVARLVEINETPDHERAGFWIHEQYALLCQLYRLTKGEMGIKPFSKWKN